MSGSDVSKFFEPMDLVDEVKNVGGAMSLLLDTANTVGMLRRWTPEVGEATGGSGGFLETGGRDWWRSSWLLVRELLLPERVDSEDLLGEGEGCDTRGRDWGSAAPLLQLMFISCIDFLNSSSSLEFGSMTSMTEALPVSEVSASCRSLFLRSALLRLLSSLPPVRLGEEREVRASSEAVSLARW